MAIWLPSHDLVLVDVPKTGSHWCGGVFTRRGGHGAFPHQPAWALPDEGLTRVAAYRDPWTWYASLYAHGMHTPEGRSRILVQTKSSSTFKDMLRVWTHPEEDPRNMLGWFLPINCPVQAPLRSRKYLFNAEMGLWSWLASYFLADETTWGRPTLFRWGIDVLLDQKRLVHGLSQVLREDLTAEIGMKAASGVKPSGMPVKYLDWYDEEMMGWIEERESWGQRLLGYEPGTTSKFPEALLCTRHKNASCVKPLVSTDKRVR